MRDQPSCGEKPNVRRKYLSPDEARRLIDAAATVGRNGERDKLMLALMYRHGLRVSEVIDLRWTDFDLDAPRERRFWVRRLKPPALHSPGDLPRLPFSRKSRLREQWQWIKHPAGCSERFAMMPYSSVLP